MSTKYSLTITADGGQGNTEALVDVYAGSLAVIGYAAKDALAEIEGDARKFEVTVTEIGTPGHIVNLTADAGTVADVLKARLSKLRKAAKAPAGE